MARLTQHGEATVAALSQQFGIQPEAVTSMLHAIVRGGGSMAQFSHPAFGGSGQWMRGGMTMTSDMFNHQLNGLVNGLCAALSDAMNAGPLLTPERGDPGFAWWPADLGTPSSTGGQNNDRYAIFPNARRLAVQRGGTVTVYDTGEHHVGGVSQAQDGFGTRLTFSSQFGQFDVSVLTPVGAPGQKTPPEAPAAQDTAQKAPDIADAPPQRTAPAQQAAPAPQTPSAGADPMATLERLAALMERGLLTREEFDAKKTDLLSRL